MFLAGGIGSLIADYMRRRFPLFLGLILLLFMGIVFGTISVQSLSPAQKSDLSGYIQGFYGSFPQEISVSNRQALAKQGMVDNIVKTTGLMWLLGLTVIGAPLILGIVFLRGFVIGFTVGFIVEEMFLTGIALSAASILPHNLLVIPAVIIGGVGALSFSISAFKTLIGNNQESTYPQFISCTFVAIVSSSLLALAAFVEAFITPVFIQLAQRFLV